MTDPDAVLGRIDAAITACICGEPITKQSASLDYCSEDCQEEWLRLRRTYNLPGRVALRRAAASIQITTRVMWVPGDSSDLTQGIDLTPYLTGMEVVATATERAAEAAAEAAIEIGDFTQ